MEENNEIRNLLQLHNLSIADFANKFSIPKRTVENWVYNISRCPEYTLKLIKDVLEKEKTNEQTKN